MSDQTSSFDRRREPVADTAERRGLAALAIRRPVGTMAIASVVIVMGLFFLQRLPVDLLPTIAYPEIRVNVNYPGTAPEVMEQQVTRVLERNLAGAEGLVSLQSSASEGSTGISLMFELGTDLDLALQDASRLLERARAQLPRDIDPPRIRKLDPSQMPVFQAGSVRRPGVRSRSETGSSTNCHRSCSPSRVSAASKWWGGRSGNCRSWSIRIDSRHTA
jgi:hypothetical protein